MSEVIAESHVDGSKDDTGPEKLKVSVNETTPDIDGSGDAQEEPAKKKAKLAKENSVKDDKSANDSSLDKPETNSRGSRGSKSSARRSSTLSRLAKEGEDLLKKMGHKDENPEGQGRRTRSQTRGTPQKAATPRQQETSKRSRRGRPKRDEKPEKEESDKEEEDEEEEEEEENGDDVKVESKVNNTGAKAEKKKEASAEESAEDTSGKETGDEESKPEGDSEPPEEKND